MKKRICTKIEKCPPKLYCINEKNFAQTWKNILPKLLKKAIAFINKGIFWCDGVRPTN